jgi:hypothetical protein
MISKKYLVIKKEHEGKYINMYGPFDTIIDAEKWIKDKMQIFIESSNFSIQEIFSPN